MTEDQTVLKLIKYLEEGYTKQFDNLNKKMAVLDANIDMLNENIEGIDLLLSEIE